MYTRFYKASVGVASNKLVVQWLDRVTNTVTGCSYSMDDPPFGSVAGESH